jgi:predicted nucleic acid-binding protein
MAVVLDASAALSFLVASQVTLASERFRQSLREAPLIAPAVFRWELRHALLKLERRGLVSPQALEIDLVELEQLVDIAPDFGRVALASLITLARAEELGAYDAAYLQLAIERGALIASRDAALIEAALRRSVGVVDLR